MDQHRLERIRLLSTRFHELQRFRIVAADHRLLVKLVQEARVSQTSSVPAERAD